MSSKHTHTEIDSAEADELRGNPMFGEGFEKPIQPADVWVKFLRKNDAASRAKLEQKGLHPSR
jgi:hypothetical protein